MVFLITGPDTYRARRKLKELRDKFRREVDESGLNMHTIDGLTLDVQDLAHSFDATPLLARKRFVVFEGLLKNKKKDIYKAVLEALARTSLEGNVIVFFEDEPPVQKHPLASWLKEHAYVQTYSTLKSSELTRWVNQEFKKRERSITPAALRKLIETAGSDSWGLVSEIDKLDSYLGEGLVVDEAVVEFMASGSFREDIFSLVDAMVMGHLSQGAPLLMEHLAHGLFPQQLVALLEKQLRILIMLSEAKGSRSLSLPGIHPYAVKKLSPLAHRVDTERVKKVYQKLAEVDIELKTETGSAKAIFLNYLTELAAIK